MDDSFIPDWLLRQQLERETRPKSPEPEKSPRPKSAKYRQRDQPSKPTVINVPERNTDKEDVTVNEGTQTADEVGIQTEKRLLEEYDHNEDEVTTEPWAEYQVYVRTGNRVGAATKADVRITFYGEKGRSKELLLEKSFRNKVKFQSGKVDIFWLPAYHVGRLRKIKIGHDRRELSYAWYLESVSVFDMNDKRIYDFQCDSWLSGAQGDGKTYRDYPVDSERVFTEAFDDVKGRRSTKAGRDRRKKDDSSEDRASKDDKHSLWSLKGSRREDTDSSRTSSSSSGSSESKDDFFDKQLVPTFAFRSYSNDGKTAEEEHMHGYKKKLPSTAKISWDIHSQRYVRVKAMDDSFIPDWLLRQQSERETRPKSPEPEKSPRPKFAKYRQRDQPSKPTVINVPERNTDKEDVTVNEGTQAADEVGIQTEKRLLEEYDHTEDEVTTGPWAEYQVYVRTGNRVGAATKADVRITFYGEKGRSKELLLKKSVRNKVKLQSGKEDCFLLPAHHVGRLRKIKIGHDRRELSYAWYLESVSVFDMNDKRIYDFQCDSWLSGVQGDGKTYRDYPVDSERTFIEAFDDVKGRRSTKAGRDRRKKDDSSEDRASKDDKHSLWSLKGSRGEDTDSSRTSSSSSGSSESKDDFFDKQLVPTFAFRSYSNDDDHEAQSSKKLAKLANPAKLA